MYKSFFNFHEKPFSLRPDPAFLYLGGQHKHALTILNYGLSSEAGLTVITGEVGAGKTTLIYRLLENLDDNVNVGMISNAQGAFGELLQWVMMAFELEYKDKTKTELYQFFNDYLIQQYAKNKRAVLIIDEAQNLNLDTLEELRMLTNINSGKHMLLQLVLVGQPELLETLRRPELRQLAQRVSVDYHLHSMRLSETVAYIRHRIKHAGGDPRLFHPYACAVVHYYSQGIPRLINTLCDFALVYAFAEEKRLIDAQLILDVIKDKQQSGIFPMPKHENEEAKKIRHYLQEKLQLEISLESLDREGAGEGLDLSFLERY